MIYLLIGSFVVAVALFTADWYILKSCGKEFNKQLHSVTQMVRENEREKCAQICIKTWLEWDDEREAEAAANIINACVSKIREKTGEVDNCGQQGNH